MEHKLLTRDLFREGVFARDNNRCVLCAAPAQDAHHILERRLWPDGGYYLDNGASVCGGCHLLCEATDVSLDTIREAAGIKKPIIPPHLYSDQEYDKWGNPILPNGTRIRGELFEDLSVKKVLAKHLHEFTHHVKYPRTYHLPWSENLTTDDRMHSQMIQFHNREVVITEKMDGENTTLYTDYIHARSVDSKNHPSRNWVKGFWSRICGDIPPEWRVCGENMYAEHSIAYDNLKSYFYGFSIWNDKNVCLSWDETLEWFQLLNVAPVRVLYRGTYDEKIHKAIWTDKQWGNSEGYVMRVADEIPYSQFKTLVGKFVRKNHVQTVKHWMHGQAIVPNKLANE